MQPQRLGRKQGTLVKHTFTHLDDIAVSKTPVSGVYR